jgi:hypothetical protein
MVTYPRFKPAKHCWPALHRIGYRWDMDRLCAVAEAVVCGTAEYVGHVEGKTG